MTPGSSEGLDSTARRHHRIAVWCGALVTIGLPVGWGFFGGFLLPPRSPSATPQEIATFVAEGGVLQKVGLMMALASLVGILPVSAVLGDQMRRMEGPRPVWAQTQLACATLLVWLLSAAFVSKATATFRPDRNPELIQLMHDHGWLNFITPVSMVVLWMACVGAAILSDRNDPPVMPRWMGYLSIWAALLSAPGFAAVLFHTGPFAWNGLFSLWIPLVIFFVWWIALMVQLLRAINHEAEPSTGVSTAVREELRVEEGVWVVVLGELCVFTLFFTTFLYYRAFSLEVYEASRATLRQDLGALNTMILLASSWLVASGTRALRAPGGGAEHRSALPRFAAAFACGGAFIAVKGVEYHGKISAGVNVATDEFFMFYFMLTGIHLMHVVVGMVLLGSTVLHLRSAFSTGGVVSDALIGFASCFWHMVDLLWIVLFPLLYLLQ